MIDAIAITVQELARYALLAYAIRNGRDVLLKWLDRLPTKPTAHEVIDAAREHGLELQRTDR